MKSLTSFFGAVAAAVLVAGGAQSFAADVVSNQDKEFLKDAAELGATEVELGRLGEQKAADPALKSMSAKLVQDHTKANAELKALARSKGVELKAEPSGAQKHMLDAFAGKSGAEFDKEFREHLVKDHDKAIHTFQTAARDSKDPDIRSWAEKMLPGLEQHRQMAAGKMPAGQHEMRTTEERSTIEKRGGKHEGQVRTE